MKVSTMLRLIAPGVLGAMLLVWAGAFATTDPAGDSPQHGIPQSAAPYELCSTQTLAPGAQVWLKVTYHAGKELEMHVKTADGLHFDVYDPSQVANSPTLPPQPIRRLLPDPFEPGYTDTWKGHLGLGNQFALVRHGFAFHSASLCWCRSCWRSPFLGAHWVFSIPAFIFLMRRRDQRLAPFIALCVLWGALAASAADVKLSGFAVLVLVVVFGLRLLLARQFMRSVAFLLAFGAAVCGSLSGDLADSFFDCTKIQPRTHLRDFRGAPPDP